MIHFYYYYYYYYKQLNCWKNIGNFLENYYSKFSEICRKSMTFSGKIFPPQITNCGLSSFAINLFSISLLYIYCDAEWKCGRCGWRAYCRWRARTDWSSNQVGRTNQLLLFSILFDLFLCLAFFVIICKILKISLQLRAKVDACLYMTVWQTGYSIGWFVHGWVTNWQPSKSTIAKWIAKSENLFFYLPMHIRIKNTM